MLDQLILSGLLGKGCNQLEIFLAKLITYISKKRGNSRGKIFLAKVVELARVCGGKPGRRKKLEGQASWAFSHCLRKGVQPGELDSPTEGNVGFVLGATQPPPIKPLLCKRH